MARDTPDDRSDPRTTYNLLFVCTGNTCRSPMAEALARAELERRGWSHVRVASAGVAAAAGAPASPQAVSAARRHHLDLAGHASRPLTPDLVEWADLVLAMGPSHLDVVGYLGGQEKMALLPAFAAGDPGEARGVTDPFGEDEATYERTLRELEGLVSRSLDRLAPILAP